MKNMTILSLIFWGVYSFAGITPTADQLLPSQTSQAGKYLQTDGTNISWAPGDGVGTVTSVAMTVPPFLSVSGSPITASGTLAVTLAVEAANKVLAGPVSGGSVAPTFRALVPDDLKTGGTNAQCLKTDGAGLFVWAACSTGDATSIQGVAVSASPPSNGDVLQYNSTSTQYEPAAGGGGGGNVLSSNWSSNNVTTLNVVGTASGIVGDSAAIFQYVVGTTDIPLLDTTTSAGQMVIAGGSILEPTSTQTAGEVNIQAGRALGAGYGGEIDIESGTSVGGGGGFIRLDAGADSAGGDGGSILLYAGGSPAGNAGDIKLGILAGMSAGHIYFQPESSGAQATIGDVWTATSTTGAGHWASAGGGGGSAPTSQILTSGTNATYTTPVGAVGLKVTIVGGGGGGGGCAATSGSQNSAGGGGAGGGASVSWISSPAGSYHYTVGAAGGAGTAGVHPGTTGGTTCFGTNATACTSPLLQATGGDGGDGGPAVSGAGLLTGNSVPGVGSSGDLNLSGGIGPYGYVLTIGAPIGGYGGGSMFAPAAGDIAGGGGTASAVACQAGLYGGGGGACANGINGSDGSGASACAGVIIVEEYY